MSSESQSPKLRRTEGWVKVIASIFALLGSAWVGVMTLWSNVGNLTTDEELIAHNERLDAHPPIQKKLEKCQEDYRTLSKKLDKDHQEMVHLGGRLVRLIAADRETNRTLRAAAATYYQEEYMRLVHKGMGVEEAMLEALRSPWYDKPRATR